MSITKPIYMDHSATTAVSEKALDAMIPYFRTEFGNPSAVYNYGQSAHNALEKCRNSIAKQIGALSTEIYFTSGGTESDNWVIRSVCQMKKCKGRHIISTEIEHNAVRRTLEQMEAQGFDVTYLIPDKYGHISPEQLQDAIREDTILITIMLANNVVGTILNIAELSAVARKRHILFHTDAVQAIGHLPINVRKLGVDFLSASAHKFCGPKGVGFLYCRLPNRPLPLLSGGGQEKSLRSGTENIPGIVGMTTALEESLTNLENKNSRLCSMRDHLIDGLLKISGVHLTGDPANRLPGFASFLVDGISHSILLINELNARGICASSGSACSAASKEASHVILALGYDKHQASCSLRITLGDENTMEEVNFCIEQISDVIMQLRGNLQTKPPRLEGRVAPIKK